MPIMPTISSAFDLWGVAVAPAAIVVVLSSRIIPTSSHFNLYILFLFIYGFPPPTTLMLSNSKSSCLQIQCHLLIVIITLEHDDIPHNIFQHFVGVLFLFSLSQLRHWHCKEARSKISCMLHTPMITCDWDITPSIKDSGNTSYIDENDLASLKNL